MDMLSDLLKYHDKISQYLEQGELAAALPVFEEAIEQYPNDAILLFYGSVIFAQDNPEKALACANLAEQVILNTNQEQIAPLVSEHLAQNAVPQAVAVLTKFIKNVFYFDVALANDEKLTLDIAYAQLALLFRKISEMAKQGTNLESRIDVTLALLKEILMHDSSAEYVHHYTEKRTSSDLATPLEDLESFDHYEINDPIDPLDLFDPNSKKPD